MDAEIRNALITSFCPVWLPTTQLCDLGENLDGSDKTAHQQLAEWVTTAIRGEEYAPYIAGSLGDALKEAIECHDNPECDAPSQEDALVVFLKKLYANLKQESTYRDFAPFYDDLKTDIAYMIPNKVPKFMLEELFTGCCGYRDDESWRTNAENYIKELFDRYDPQVIGLVEMGFAEFLPVIKHNLYLFWIGQLRFDEHGWM